MPGSSPFISAASFPKGKGIGIDYLFGVGGGGVWEAGGCWQGGLGARTARKEAVRWPSGVGPRVGEVDSDLF